MILGSPRNAAFVEPLACTQTATATNWYRGAAEAVARNIDRIAERGGEDVEDFVIASGTAIYNLVWVVCGGGGGCMDAVCVKPPQPCIIPGDVNGGVYVHTINTHPYPYKNTLQKHIIIPKNANTGHSGCSQHPSAAKCRHHSGHPQRLSLGCRAPGRRGGGS